jgi:putative aldouronate transport system substrate-binding protein
MSLTKTDVFKLVDQKFAEWIYKNSVDAQWDDYLKLLDQMGLPLMEKIYQQGYDNYYKE